MKIYVSSSENIKAIPEVAKSMLKKLKGENPEFIMGTYPGADEMLRDYLCQELKADVTVYAPEDEEIVASGAYEVKSFKPRFEDEQKIKSNSRFMHDSFVFSDADYYLLKTAAYGIFLWDGENERIFLNIAEMVWNKRPVEVYSFKDSNIYKIEKPEELKRLVGEPDEHYAARWDIMPLKYYKEAVKKCMISEDMKDFLSEGKASKDTAVDMIIYSPIPLHDKLELLEKMSVVDNRYYELAMKICAGKRSRWCDGVEGLYHDISMGLFGFHAEKLRNALNELKLKPGEIFVLKRVDYIYPEKDFKRCETAELKDFEDYDSAMEFLQKYVNDEKINHESMCWFVLEKRVPVNDENAGREFDSPYSYYFVRDELVSFCKNSQRINGTWYENPKYINTNFLHLYTPYSAGTIVKIDNRPFAPLTYVLMLENGYDDNGVRAGGKALFRTKEGKWTYRSINEFRPDNCNYCHNFGFPSYYGLSRYDGELPEEFLVFKVLQKALDGDTKKAELLMERLEEMEEEEYIIGITDDVINEFAKSDWVNDEKEE